MAVFTPKEICKFLQENHCRITEQDIIHPDPAMIRQLYLCFVNIFTPGRMDEINRDLENKRKNLLNFEYQEDKEKAYLIYKDMEYLLSYMGYHDIKYSDMLEPQQSSVIKILSSIIDFIKFRGGLWPIFDKRFCVFEEIDQACRKKQDKIEQFKREYPAAKVLYEQNMSKIEQLGQIIKEADEKLLKLRNEGHGYAVQLEAYKRERGDLKDKMQEIQYNTMGYETELEKLKEAEAFDTEGTIQKNNDLRQSIKQFEMDLQKDESTLAEWYREIESKNTVIDKLQEGLKQVLEDKKVHVAYEKYLKEERTLMAQLEKLDSNIARLEKDRLLLTEQTTKYESKIQEIDKNIAKRREDLQKFNQNFRTRLDNAYKECQNVDAACADMDKKTKEYNKKIQELRKRDEEFETLALKELSDINQMVIQYLKSLEEATKDE